MSVVVEDKQGKRQIITKGAVEEMLDICSYAEFDGAVHPLSAELRKKSAGNQFADEQAGNAGTGCCS